MVDTFREMADRGHEQIVFCYDATSHLRAIIAVHSTVLGPALGGTRVWAYESTDAALIDVLRLSKGMTYKASVAGLALGGGKAVIVKDPKNPPTLDTFRVFGKFVESLGGRYVTAEDVGTDEAAMNAIRESTRHVTGGVYEGGYGDPSPITAIGVFEGIKAAAEKAFGSPDMKGKTVAVQGVGHVGSYICKLLAEAGAKLIVSDIVPAKVEAMIKQLKAKACPGDQIAAAECDVFCPSALGGVINDQTVGKLRCRVVAGAANNPLAEDRHADELAKRNILYIPDYAINSGGLIHVGSEYLGMSKEQAVEKAVAVGQTIRKIIQIADMEGITTLAAANRMAEARIAKARGSKSSCCGCGNAAKVNV